MTLRAVVVDDEDLARQRVRELVEGHDGLTLAGEAADGARALDVVTELRPDVVFLDVQMPELDGFEVVASLDPDVLPGVVFVTAYDDYALRAFDVGAFDYLLKPITRERFDEAVARLTGRMPLREQSLRARALAADVQRERGWARRLVARKAGRHYFVPVRRVDWIEADGNYLRVHVAERTHLVRMSMKEAEARLDPERFVRIHRSTIVAIDRIGSIRSSERGGWIVTLADGTDLPSSRSYTARVRRLLR